MLMAFHIHRINQLNQRQKTVFLIADMERLKTYAYFSIYKESCNQFHCKYWGTAVVKFLESKVICGFIYNEGVQSP